jgi:hypothetical protein
MSQELHEKQLLSLFFLRFTHTPTRTRLRACARDRGERRKKPVPCMATVAACSPRLAHVGVAGRLGRNDPHAPLGATRGRTVAHATPATLAELKTSGQPVYGSFPTAILRRGTREQPPFQAEFVFVVRTSPGENPCPNRQTENATVCGTGTKSSFPPRGV